MVQTMLVPGIHPTDFVILTVILMKIVIFRDIRGATRPMLHAVYAEAERTSEICSCTTRRRNFEGS